MGLDDKDMTQKSTILVGFSGETQQTIGEIILPTYDKGINLQTKFNVLDCPSAYNIILGTPWIHKMKAIPSTNHLNIEFPTEWGVHEIKRELKAARKCFNTSLKLFKPTI